MIDNYHGVLTAAAVTLGACNYLYYLFTVWKGRTRPHLFTWLSYALINSTVLAVQIIKGGGVGSLAMGIATAGAVFGTIASIIKGERDIRPIDWGSLLSVLVGIALWAMTSNALYAVVIASIINAVGLVPTIRKSIAKPWEEPVVGWLVSVFQFGLGAFALETFTLTTALFPILVAAMNALLVAILLVRRRQLGNTI